MNDAILVELRFFGVSFFWGMLLLVIYDTLRVFRRVINHNSFFIAFEDILYWVTCGILIFHMMYRQNNGIIRGFSILAMLLGMLLYHESLSELLVNIISGLLNGLIHGIARMIAFLLKPIRFLLKRVGRLFAWLFSKIRKMAHSIAKALKYVWNSSKIAVTDSEDTSGKGD